MAHVVSRGRFLPSLGGRARSSGVVAPVSGCPFGPSQPPAAAACKAGWRPYEEIPTPRRLPLLGLTAGMLASGATKIHEYCDQKHRELGPIFRDKLGTVEAVVIADTDSIHRTYLSEGKYPTHIVPEAWTIYNKKTGIKRGLFFMEGEQWFKRRELLNKVLFSPKAVSSHGPAFNHVISDLLGSWERMCSTGGPVPDLEHELYNWSVECLGAMVFGRRLGCVSSQSEASPEMPQKFVNVVQQIFHESARMTLIPPKLAYNLNLPVWRRFSEAATDALDIARKYVQKRIKEIGELQAQGVEVSGVLSQLMADKEIQQEEIVQIVADLVIAAADTTSHAIQWALHLLATNPECQEKFLSQINGAVSPGQLIEEQHLAKIPYAMWTIKEALRMYPIASFLTRVLPKDVVLRNYHIPKGTMIVMSQYTVGRDKHRFPEPDKFLPERWKQPEDRHQRTGNQGCIPFGTGARSCIGRRVAELQMRLLLARTIQRFQLESANEKDVGIVIRMITAPDVPIRLRLHRRTL